MARTRRRGGKARSYQTGSPAAGSNGGATAPTTRVGTRSSAASAGKPVGSTTQNSRGNQGKRGSSSSKRIPAPRRVSLRGRGRPSKKELHTNHGTTSYRDEQGKVYQKGGAPLFVLSFSQS